MNTFFNRLQHFRNRSKGVVLDIIPIILRHAIFLIHIIVANEVLINCTRLPIIHLNRLTVDLNGFPGEILNRCLGGTIIQDILNLLLEVRNKRCVALAGDDGEDIDLMDFIAQCFRVHTIACLIDAQAQAAANLLPLLCGAVTVLQSTNLEHIRVVPTFPQSGVRENKPSRFFKGQQPFLVFQNQIVGRNIIRHIRATFHRAVHAATSLFINAEVAAMHLMDIDSIQILHVVSIQEVAILVQNRDVLLLEDSTIFTELFIPIFIILAVFRHFINEEQGQRFDSQLEQLLLLLEMGNDRLTDLHPAHIHFRYITSYITLAQLVAVCKGDNSGKGVNFRDHKTFILLHFTGDIIQIISYPQRAEFTFASGLVRDLHLQPCHWRVL